VGLDVGLVEAGEDPLGVRRLELRVHVDLAVRGVPEAVEAFAGAGVDGLRRDDEGVLPGGEVGELDAALLVVGSVRGERNGGAGDVGAVEGDRVDRGGTQVDEGGPRIPGGEGDRGGAGEGAVGQIAACGEVEDDAVVDAVDERGPVSGLAAGEVG
jgi:hypothetical protein